MKKLSDFLNDQSGATAIEYALIASAVFVAIVAVVNRVGAKLNTVFTTVSNGL
ncbi:MAG TPA: Flp family type IVb pilin [Xanthobacteraceae bacterium]|jgi:pilus assembly protein Flp/PilA|nr:Flp family type IVb pilin [Xanthobacteraceae bacterium]